MEEKKNMKKATLDALLERARQSAEDKTEYKEFESEVLGMSLTLKRMRLTEYLRLMDNTEDVDSMVDSLECYKEMIYKSCPIIQKRELLEAYGCAEPYDIVTKLFDDNFGEILRCANAINGMYGIIDDIEAVKN